jgi:phosphotransacetylase
VILSKIFSQLEQFNEIKSCDIVAPDTRDTRHREQAPEAREDGQARQRQEQSKERILESIKSLEMRIDNFTQINEQHTQLIQQMLSQNRKSAQSRQSNYSVDINQQMEAKETGTP